MDEGLTMMNKKEKRFAHCTLVSGMCTCFYVLHGKGTVDGLVEEGFSDEDVSRTSVFLARTLGGHA